MTWGFAQKTYYIRSYDKFLNIDLAFLVFENGETLQWNVG